MNRNRSIMKGDSTPITTIIFHSPSSLFLYLCLSLSQSFDCALYLSVGEDGLNVLYVFVWICRPIIGVHLWWFLQPARDVGIPNASSEGTVSCTIVTSDTIEFRIKRGLSAPASWWGPSWRRSSRGSPARRPSGSWWRSHASKMPGWRGKSYIKDNCCFLGRYFSMCERLRFCFSIIDVCRWIAQSRLLSITSTGSAEGSPVGGFVESFPLWGSLQETV